MALLAHFGSIDAVMAATPEELEGVPGLPAATARQIHTSLHRIGGRAPGASQGGRRPLPEVDA
jgi:DNA repair protein RadC